MKTLPFAAAIWTSPCHLAQFWAPPLDVFSISCSFCLLVTCSNSVTELIVFSLYRMLKRQERKVRIGEERGDTIDITVIGRDTRIDTRGYVYILSFSNKPRNLPISIMQISIFLLGPIMSYETITR